jgi:signal transduction histidine kinase
MNETVKILIVEDDPHLLRALSRLLREAGYQVIEAAADQEGLRLAKETEPDLILHGFVKKDGQVLDVLLLALAERDESGEVIRSLAVPMDIIERNRAEKPLQKLTHDLGERVKELSCLYGISSLAGRQGISLEGILQGIVDLIPASWQYPGITAARVILEGQEFRTRDFREAATWRQAADIMVHGQRSGSVEVCYLEERPEGDEGPFLKQERKLLNAIAERLGRIVERIQAEEALAETNQLLETILDHTHMLVVFLDPQFNFIWVNRAYAVADEREASFFPGKNHFDLYPNAENEEIFRRVVATGESYFAYARPFEYEEHPERGVTYWDWSLIPIKDPGGAVTGLVLTLTDVTERKRAETALRRTHDELATLLAVSNDIVSTLELRPLLNLILEQLKKVVAYSGAAILTLAQDIMDFQAYRGPRLQIDMLSLRFSPAQIPVIREMIATRQAFCIADIRDDALLAQAIEGAIGLPIEKVFLNGRSWIGVPLIVKSKVIGMLSLVHNEPNYYQPQALNLVQTFANQVAIAIDNAHLYQQAQETAAIAERARLARELHDSVTQALYSAGLYADATCLALSSGKTDVAAENVRQLRSLVEEAMSDMRLLVFELHPPILEETGLVGALQARLEAVEARSGLETAFRVERERRLPLSIEAQLYRVAQEALNNVIKHAQAKQVIVHLQFNEERFCLTIQDDGIGFDLETVGRSGGLGLRGIKERVQQIGGDLTLETAPGKGTTLRIEVGI